MKIREYKIKYCQSLEDEILYAGEYLESQNYAFLQWFGTHNAVDRAAWVMTESLEKETNKKGFFGGYWK